MAQANRLTSLISALIPYARLKPSTHRYTQLAALTLRAGGVS